MIINDYKDGLDPRTNLTIVKVVFVALPIIFLIELAIAGLVKKEKEVKQQDRTMHHVNKSTSMGKKNAVLLYEVGMNNGVLNLDLARF